MTPYWSDDAVTVYAGDCLDVLRELPDASVDAVVTDPPYGLEFMGREWDAPWKIANIDVRTQKMMAGSEAWPEKGGAGTAAPYEKKPRWSPRTSSDATQSAARSEAAAFQQWCEQWATECLRVLKPGGHLLAFGGTRTWHRLACAIEDAGFEVRDSIAWLYGSGFPKSLDVGKAIDKAAGAEREVVGTHPLGRATGHMRHGGENGRPWQAAALEAGHGGEITAPATDDARTWQGWGTALKPAHEPIVVARKPLAGTVAANVLAHGTGALHVDGCRVAHASEADRAESVNKNQHATFGTAPGGNQVYGDYSTTPVKDYDGSAGRWPPNVVLGGEDAAAELDRQSGTLTSNPGTIRTARPDAPGEFLGGKRDLPGRVTNHGDSGGASRFFPVFRYEAKAPTLQRPTHWRPSCQCEQSSPPPRDTDASGSPDDKSWNTSTSGNGTTDPSPSGTTSTTGTATNSTTTSPTSNSSRSSSTNASTPGATSGPASGGNPAPGAESSSLSTQTIGTSPSKGGRSTGVAPARSPAWSERSVCGNCGAPAKAERHATVKPLDLMRWLIRLVTPPGGTILDPFAGSGTTGEAAVLEHMRAILIEREPDYLPLIVARLSKPLAVGFDFEELGA